MCVQACARSLPILSYGYFVALIFENFAHEFADIRFVVNDEYVCLGHLRL